MKKILFTIALLASSSLLSAELEDFTGSCKNFETAITSRFKDFMGSYQDFETARTFFEESIDDIAFAGFLRLYELGNFAGICYLQQLGLRIPELEKQIPKMIKKISPTMYSFEQFETSMRIRERGEKSLEESLEEDNSPRARYRLLRDKNDIEALKALALLGGMESALALVPYFESLEQDLKEIILLARFLYKKEPETLKKIPQNKHWKFLAANMGHGKSIEAITQKNSRIVQESLFFLWMANKGSDVDQCRIAYMLAWSGLGNDQDLEQSLFWTKKILDAYGQGKNLVMEARFLERDIVIPIVFQTLARNFLTVQSYWKEALLLAYKSYIVALRSQKQDTLALLKEVFHKFPTVFTKDTLQYLEQNPDKFMDLSRGFVKIFFHENPQDQEFYEINQWKDGVRLLRSSFQGNIKLQFEISRFLILYRPISQDEINLGFKFLKEEVLQNWRFLPPEDQVKLAHIFLDSNMQRPFDISPRDILAFFKNAEKNGLVDNDILGDFYFSGHDVKKDNQKAIKYYQAKMLEDVPFDEKLMTLNNLCVIHMRIGNNRYLQGDPQYFESYDRAEEFLDRAIENGVNILPLLYSNRAALWDLGRSSAGRNIEKAIYFYEIAFERGIYHSAKCLSYLYNAIGDMEKVIYWKGQFVSNDFSSANRNYILEKLEFRESELSEKMKEAQQQLKEEAENPENIEAKMTLGAMYLSSQENVEEGERLLEDLATSEDPHVCAIANSVLGVRKVKRKHLYTPVEEEKKIDIEEPSEAIQKLEFTEKELEILEAFSQQQGTTKLSDLKPVLIF